MLARTALLLTLPWVALAAQELDLEPRPPRDSALARAWQLAAAGNAQAGRQLVDSVVAASEDDPSMHAEALFWRGALAESPADAERSYRRLLIEAPLSDRAEDALLQLARLDATRGNRRGASDHLYRYMLSYGNSPERPDRPRVSLWLVRLLFEQPDRVVRACEALRMSRDAIPAENVELRNQLAIFEPRCAQPAAVAAEGPVARDSIRPAADARAEKPDSALGRYYTVQVAAYDSREAAARMAELLRSRGIDARVDGDRRPYRVRVGRYATRAEAARMHQSLRSQGQNGFITVAADR